MFGLWTLVFSLLGLFEWLDLGFFPAIIKYVAQCHALHEPMRRNQILSTIAFSYLILAIIGTTALAVLSLFFNRLFEIPQDLMSPALWLLGILTVRTVLLGLPLAIFRGILFGEQHMVLLNLTSALFNIAYGLGGWLSLNLGYGIVALAWINLAAFLFESLTYCTLCYRYVPALKLSWALVDLKIVGEISSLNLTQFVANTSSLLVQRAGPIIVQIALNLTAVTLYAIPLKIVTYLYMLLKQFTNSLSPAIVHLKAIGDHERLNNLIVSCTKIATALASIFLIATGLFGGFFITLWVGEGFQPSVPVLIVLLLAMWISAPEIVASEALVMTGHHVLLIKYFLLQTLINIGVSLALVFPLGLVGVALGTLVASLLVTVLVMAKACTIYRISIRKMLLEGLAPLLIPAAGQAMTYLLILHFWPPQGLLVLLLETIPGVAVFAGLFWKLALTDQERSAGKELVKGRKGKKI